MSQLAHACQPAPLLVHVPRAVGQFLRTARGGWEPALARARPALVTVAWRLAVTNDGDEDDEDPAHGHAHLAALADSGLRRLADLGALLPTTSAADGARVARDLSRLLQRLGACHRSGTMRMTADGC
jgi:hypothetical protein